MASFLKRITMLFLALFSASLSAQEYYVAPDGDNNNSGTLENPWKTVQHAASYAVPGSTVYVRKGTYYEKISINVSGNQKDGYITFKNYSGEPVVISGEGVAKNSASYSDDIFYIENKDYIKIEGFEIRDLNAFEGSGIRIYGYGSHIELRNNIIHNLHGGGQDGGAMGITVYGSNNKKSIQYLVIDKNTIYDCDPATSEALTLNGNIENFKVTNNIVHDVNNIGIDFIGGESWLSDKGVRNGLCIGNTVFNAHSNYGDGFAAGIYVDGASDITITGNEVYQCDLGIEIGAENKGVVVKNIEVSHNTIRDNDKAGISMGGYRESAGIVKQCQIIKNQIIKNNTLKTEFGQIWLSFTRNCLIQENTIEPFSNTIAVYAEDGAEKIHLDYNTYVGNVKSYVWDWKSEWYEGLKAFQEGSGQEKHARIKK